MKPGFTPYQRNSRIGLKMLTVNPCNEFIIESLLRWKVKMEKHGLNQFYTYNLAIEAVRKYPMPILCWEQMKAMEGFGKFFCTTVGKLVRSHYNRGRMPTQQQKDQDDKDHEQLLKHEMKKFKIFMKNNHKSNGASSLSGLEGFEDQDQDQDQDNQSQYSEFNDNFESQFHEEEDQDQQDDDDDNSSVCSSMSDSSNRSNRSYKPKPGSDNFNMFRAINVIMAKCQKQTGSAAMSTISLGEINCQLFEWKMDKVKNWTNLSKRLEKSGYIRLDQKDEYAFILTTKGKDFLIEVEQSEKTKFNENTNIVIFRKQKLKVAVEPDKLVMLSNMRGSYKPPFISVLAESMKDKLKQADYQLGSFLWSIEDKLLDYIVIWFKADELDEEDFLEICIRARNSTCNYVTIILEYSSESSRKASKTKETMSTLIANCRASGFKVLQFYNSGDSIKYLTEVTERLRLLISRIPQGQQIMLLGLLKIYNDKNRKLPPTCLKQVTRKMMKCIPKINRDEIEIILEKLPTFCIIQTYLQRLQNSQERVKFMMWALGSFIRYKLGTLQMLDDLLFRPSYELDDEFDDMEEAKDEVKIEQSKEDKGSTKATSTGTKKGKAKA